MSEAPELSPRELAERLTAGDVQLIDVREPEEWDAARIAGARHVPLMQIPVEAPSFDPERPVVLYCRSGTRSAMATEALRSAGFDALHLGGGLLAWHEQGLPLEPEGSAVP